MKLANFKSTSLLRLERVANRNEPENRNDL